MRPLKGRCTSWYVQSSANIANAIPALSQQSQLSSGPNQKAVQEYDEEGRREIDYESPPFIAADDQKSAPTSETQLINRVAYANRYGILKTWNFVSHLMSKLCFSSYSQTICLHELFNAMRLPAWTGTASALFGLYKILMCRLTEKLGGM